MGEVSQAAKGEAFHALHQASTPFVIPNPWDAGTAKLLASLGFRALATTSVMLAFSLGRRDGQNLVDRDTALANAASIVSAVDLPVSADLENCYGDAPEVVAETIRRAAAAGLVGCSVEDSTGNPERPIYDMGLAVERVAAAVEAARALPFRFTLTARSENFFQGRADLDDTIARLVAFERAGADVLYAPALPSLNAIRTVCAAVSKPVNVVMGSAKSWSVAELGEAGVRRISVGGALARAALEGFLKAATEIRDSGTFGFGKTTPTFGEIFGHF
jgi:2-methylisocitrate lyase-like PEP mutase family enzyme